RSPSTGRKTSEDQFLCSICLDVFTDPVTTPCGHNFCKNCITTHWNINDRCQCPKCKKVFKIRPELHINTFISEVVAQFKHEAQQKTIPCDVCLKRHQLIDPLFCQTDQTCVCMLCSVLDHKTHEFVPLKEGYEGKKAELEETEAEIQQMIQKRRLKIQEIKRLVNFSKEKADGEIGEGVRVFTALMESVQRSLNNLIDEIEDKQKTTDKQAEDFITELEQEISELMKRSTEVEQAVAQLEETLSEEMKKLTVTELKRIQRYAFNVTFDPDTAHPELILSDDGKQVNHGDLRKNLPNNRERFSDCLCVLGKQSFSSGKIYYKVQVKGKTDWDLGVVRESINRKGFITLSPADGNWTICLRNGNEYKALDEPPVRLSLKSQPEKVGELVEYEEGLVFFSDVAAAALIYSFTGCSFTEKLYLYFGPCPNGGGKNSAPLIITPINCT
uniref:E3 ubiquitin-protein ligase TRIM21-like n=1 Tax=Seriola dumerili TaxID=41447 RepID=A0A3B4VLD4_SERDU